MLVLSRKKNESIVINENIVITVVEVRGDKVRLGIQAPRDVSIHRQRGLRSDEARPEHGVAAGQRSGSGNRDSRSADFQSSPSGRAFFMRCFRLRLVPISSWMTALSEATPGTRAGRGTQSRVIRSASFSGMTEVFCGTRSSTSAVLTVVVLPAESPRIVVPSFS